MTRVIACDAMALLHYLEECVTLIFGKIKQKEWKL